MQTEQKARAESVQKPAALLVTPNTLSSNLPCARQTPTLPCQPVDRGVPHSPSAMTPDSPDVGLSVAFCREQLKKKFELCGNDGKSYQSSLRADPNFAVCMHALATFHLSFDPIELVKDKGCLCPCHGQHPENANLWKDTDCETHCVKPRRAAGLLGHCSPCEKKRKCFLQKAKRKEERHVRKDDQLLVEQDRSCRPATNHSMSKARCICIPVERWRGSKDMLPMQGRAATRQVQGRSFGTFDG
jgi:hypothetical protein